MKTLIDYSNKVNIIIAIYISKLRFQACHINVRASKIDGFILETFSIILTRFWIKNKYKKT